MNPMDMMKISKLFQGFKARHPKVVSFTDAAKGKIIQGSVLEMSITDPNGQTISTNMKVQQEDLELFAMMMNLKK